MQTSDPSMPMGKSAILPLNDSLLPQVPTVSPGAGTPPPSTGGMMQTQGSTPAPAPGGSEAPYQVEMQPDGSSIYYIPGPSGTSTDGVVVAVNPAPKLPKSLQPQQ